MAKVARIYTGTEFVDVVGLPGEQGPQGVDGSVVDAWRGEWNSGTSYVAGDIVSLNGQTWLSQGNNSNFSPETVTPYVYRSRATPNQSYGNFVGWTAETQLLTAFGVSATGDFGSVGLRLNTLSGTVTGAVTVSIYEWQNMAGVSTSTSPSVLLATGTIEGSSITTAWTPIALTGPVTLTSGSTYLLKVSTTGDLGGLSISADTNGGITLPSEQDFDDNGTWRVQTIRVEMRLYGYSFWTLLAAKGAAGSTGATGPAGQGVPAGGTTSQILAKSSNTDYATGWVDVSGASVSFQPDAPTTPVAGEVWVDSDFVASSSTPTSAALDATSTIGGVSGTSLAADRTAWTAWTPSFTNITNGAGVFRYKQVGKTLFINYRWTGGTISGEGLQTFSFSLPNGLTDTLTSTTAISLASVGGTPMTDLSGQRLVIEVD